jgi:uncharacterized membrane protein YkoI
MKINRKILVVSTVVVALAAGGIGIAYAVGGDSEEQATGPGADRAKAAAVKAVGGNVISVERGDSGSAYEVEVKRDDGSVVEVQVTDGKAGATESDDDTGGEPEGSDSGENDD